MATNEFSKKVLKEFKARLLGLSRQRITYTPQAIERRRHDVWEMMCQDIPRAEMAKLLGVSRSLVMLDIKYWRTRGRKRVTRMAEDPLYADMRAGIIDQRIDSVIAAAFQEYSLAKGANDKYKFLDMVNKGLALQIRFLQDSGYLKRAGIDVKHSVDKQISFADRLGPDSPLAELDDASTRYKLLQLAAKIIKADGDLISVDARVVGTSVPAPIEEQQIEPTTLSEPTDPGTTA
jgi:hypothetical protein